MSMVVTQQSKPVIIGKATISVNQEGEKVIVSAAGPQEDCRNIMIAIGQKIQALDPDQPVRLGTGTTITMTLSHNYLTNPKVESGIEHLTYESIVKAVTDVEQNQKHQSGWRQVLAKAGLEKAPDGKPRA